MRTFIRYERWAYLTEVQAFDPSRLFQQLEHLQQALGYQFLEHRDRQVRYATESTIIGHHERTTM
jgi:hypothetical protein